MRRCDVPRAATTRAAVVLSATVMLACVGQVDFDRQRAPYMATDSMGAAPLDVSPVSSRAPADLVENSGAAMSRSQPGVFFTINDSGNEPWLFALDTTNGDRGRWRVDGAVNVDWESVAPGPCRPDDPAADCVYIGDTGDNAESDPDHTIYRVREPRALSARSAGSVPMQALHYRYADGPHDVEAIYVSPDGAIWFVTKRPRAASAGTLRPALVFRLPPEAWDASVVAVAPLADSLPIVPGSAIGRQITDAALAPDARHLAVRTYAQVYIYATDSVTGAVDHAVPAAVCNVAGLRERQGEGITWLDARGRLVLTSEGRYAPLFIVNCPLPAGGTAR